MNNEEINEELEKGLRNVRESLRNVEKFSELCEVCFLPCQDQYLIGGSITRAHEECAAFLANEVNEGVEMRKVFI